MTVPTIKFEILQTPAHDSESRLFVDGEEQVYVHSVKVRRLPDGRICVKTICFSLPEPVQDDPRAKSLLRKQLDKLGDVGMTKYTDAVLNNSSEFSYA